MKTIKLLLLFSTILVSTQTVSATLTVTFTGFIDTIVTGTSDSKLGLGINDYFEGEIVLNLSEMLQTDSQINDQGYTEAYYLFSGSSTLRNATGQTVTTLTGTLFRDSFYFPTNSDQVYDTLSFGAFDPDVRWNQDGGYEYLIELNFIDGILNDNTLIPNFSMLDQNDSLYNYFRLDESTFQSEGEITSVNIQYSAIPLPGALWLFLTGLFALTGFLQHRTQAKAQD